MMNITINNKPEYANDYEFIVVSKVENEFWFYGAYTKKSKAEQVAFEISGEVFHNTII